ncbi:hypothetical protein PMSM_22715 [Paenibacillus macquariensis subsp. macquariensis]|uniref:Uncharacterized protein n=1 Tax=Paenibacillus macquariensis TaxID=948756 RepID=A0ABY1KH92_9BACL|nr:hypothetical protein PMSM_22715 [Paenibacillus macquariensis subsp. macquariensis]SIR71112.1 hypothetical protein SAMN05421578_1402 [Paenibacillus macquariensis]
MKRIFKLLDISVWLLLISTIDIQIIFIILVTLTIINGAYFIRTRRSSKRLNRFYEYTLRAEGKIYLHFTPRILFGYWADSKTLTECRNNAISILQMKGYTEVRGETISLCKINDSQGYLVEEKLSKWSWNGIFTIMSTLILTCSNLRNICTLTIVRKIYLLIFRNTFNSYLYFDK